MSDWLNGFIAERNSHPRIPGEYVIITDDGVAGWTDSMFALADAITVPAAGMIDSLVLHDYMSALDYAEQILMLLQSLEAMAMQDLGSNLVAAAAAQLIMPSDEDLQALFGRITQGQEGAAEELEALDDLSEYGIPNMNPTDGSSVGDNDIDWLDLAALLTEQGRFLEAARARTIGRDLNAWYFDPGGNE